MRRKNQRNNALFFDMIKSDVDNNEDDNELEELEIKLGANTVNGRKRLKQELELDGYGELDGFLDEFEKKYGSLKKRMKTNKQELSSSSSSLMMNLDHLPYNDDDEEKLMLLNQDVGDDDDDDDDTGEEYEEPLSDDDATTTMAAAKYVPPHLRHKTSSSSSSSSRQTSKSQQQTKQEKDLYGGQSGADIGLKRQVRGLINRLAQSNIEETAAAFSRLYKQHDQQAMNTLLKDSIVTSMLSDAVLLKTHIITCCCLVAILHKVIDQKFGSIMVEYLVCKWCDTYINMYEIIDKRIPLKFKINKNQEKISSLMKELSNILLILSYLYSFNVVYAGLIYDMISYICKNNMDESSVEMILLCLQHCGYQLRRDDPLGLKKLVKYIQNSVDDGDTTNARTQYMLQEIQNLCNNRGLFAQQSTTLIPFKKQLNHILTKTTSTNLNTTELQVSMNDFLKAETNGRWWIQGASSSTTTTNVTGNNNDDDDGDISNNLLLLARKHHMSTDFRRNVFCIVMGSSDFMESFEKLDKLNIKGSQDREVVRIIMYCCGQEKIHNPYYGLLCCRLCQFKRAYKFTFQLAFWDVWKQFNVNETETTIAQWSVRQLRNMARLCAMMCNHNILLLSCLKIINFQSLSQKGVLYFHIFFEDIFTNGGNDDDMYTRDNETHLTNVFGKIAIRDEYSEIRASLQLYLSTTFLTIILKRISKANNKKMRKKWWKKQVKTVNTVLSQTIEDCMLLR